LVPTPFRVAPISPDQVEVVVHKCNEQYTSPHHDDSQHDAASHHDSYVVPDGPSGDVQQGLNASVEDEGKSDV